MTIIFKKTPDFQVDVDKNQNFIVTNYESNSTSEISYTSLIDDLKYRCEITGQILKGCPPDSVVYITPEANATIDKLIEANRNLF